MSVILFELLFCCWTLNIFYTFYLTELFWRWSANCKIYNDPHYVKDILILGGKCRCGVVQSTDAPLWEITFMRCEQTDANIIEPK